MRLDRIVRIFLECVDVEDEDESLVVGVASLTRESQSIAGKPTESAVSVAG
jgi:hypothetical protein